MAEQFYTILTNVGKAKIANSTALGTKLNLANFALGDGNGAYYNPVETQTQLSHEVWRGPINGVEVDAQNSNWIVVTTLVPAIQGGFTIREAGIFDIDGNLIAIGKYPETYKPVVDEGSSKDLYIKMILQVSNTSSVTLKVDPTVIIATKQDVQNVSDNLNTHTNTKSSTSVLGHVKAGAGVKVDSNGVLTIAAKLVEDNGMAQSAITDWNNYTTVGFYKGSDLLNQPPAPVGGDSMKRWLVTVTCDGSSVVQIAYDIATGISYKRVRIGGTTWKPWEANGQQYKLTNEDGTGLTISDSASFNSYTIPGTYAVGNSAWNTATTPNGGMFFYGTLEVLSRFGTSIVQRFTCIDSGINQGKVWTRIGIYGGGTWTFSAWQNGYAYSFVKDDGSVLDNMNPVNLNSWLTPGMFLLSGNGYYTNAPTSSTFGTLIVIKRGTLTYNQIFLHTNGSSIYSRASSDGGTTWTAWNRMANCTQEQWTVPTYSNAWSTFSGSSVGYFKDEFGLVHIVGRVKGGTLTANTAIFTLPTGYRPSVNLVFPCITAVGTDGTTASTIPIVVATTGVVSVGSIAASAGYVALEGIVPFMAV